MHTKKHLAKEREELKIPALSNDMAVTSFLSKEKKFGNT